MFTGEMPVCEQCKLTLWFDGAQWVGLCCSAWIDPTPPRVSKLLATQSNETTANKFEGRRFLNVNPIRHVD